MNTMNVSNILYSNEKHLHIIFIFLRERTNEE